MKVIVAGSRNICDYHTVEKAIKESGFEITELVSGGARGVDAVGESWARRYEIPFKVFPAQWSKFKLEAGPIRNAQMAEYAEALIAVWDGKSKGTMNMIKLARAANLKVHVTIDNSRGFIKPL